MRRILLLLLVAALAAGCSPAGDEPQTILVTGATGTQGGAVARELLERGYAVRGLTRDPASDRALALAELGAEMVRGDFDDVDSLASAMAGVHGVFAVTDFWEHGYEKEVQHGRNLVDAAKGAGVGHFVYTSVAGADDETGIAHFDSKAEVETYLHSSGLAYSVVRPVEFMDNVRWYRDMILGGTYFDPRDPDRTHQWVAASDIGFFVGEAFDNPDEWLGRTLEIAGDELTIAEYVALLSEASGVDVEYRQVPWEAYEEQAGEEMAVMVRWFDDSGYDVDIAALRGRYPDLLTYGEYLRTLDWD
jgi:uncharacterized protein YbjT (DUF2867 family)